MDHKIIPARSRIFTLILLVSMLLGACGPGAGDTPITSSAGISVWLDQSPDGWTLPLAPFTLKAHASDSDGSGITSITFLVSSAGGAPVNLGSVTTDPSQPLAYAELIWNPAAPGEYLIQAQAFSAGGSQISQAARICVSAQASVASLGNPAPGCGAGLAVPVPSTPSTLQLDIKFSATPDPVYYGQCTTEPRTLNFEAFVIDLSTANGIDPALVSVVNARYRIRNAAGGGAEFLLSLSSAGAGVYRNSVDIDAQAASALGSGDGTIEYWIEVLDLSGATARSTALTINLTYCTGGLPITPTNTPGGNVPPPPTKTPVPPKPVDTTPPVVDVTSVSAFDVYYTTGCGPNTLTVEAYVTDESGLGAVNLVISYVGTGSGAIFIAMTPIGGNIYQATHDVGNEAYAFLGGTNGQIDVYMEAQDLAGNSAGDSGGTVTVSYCPG